MFDSDSPDHEFYDADMYDIDQPIEPILINFTKSQGPRLCWKTPKMVRDKDKRNNKKRNKTSGKKKSDYRDGKTIYLWNLTVGQAHVNSALGTYSETMTCSHPKCVSQCDTPSNTLPV